MPTNQFVESGFWVRGHGSQVLTQLLIRGQTELRHSLRASGMPPRVRISSISLTHQPQQHPARDLQDTFYVSDPPKAGRPGPVSADDKQDYEEYFQNVKQVHETGKYGSIGYRYPWSEDESLKYVAIVLSLTAVTNLGQGWCCGRTRPLSQQPCCRNWPDNARMDASRQLGISLLTEFSGKWHSCTKEVPALTFG